MSYISHTASFDPRDLPSVILADLACPNCGHQDLGDACDRITDRKLLIFCDGCGAFISTLLSDEQTEAARHWARPQAGTSPALEVADSRSAGHVCPHEGR